MLQTWWLWDEVTLFRYLADSGVGVCMLFHWKGGEISDLEISGNFSSNTFICLIKFSLLSKDGNVDEDGRKRGDSTDADGISLSHGSHWIWSSVGYDKSSFALNFLFVVENSNFTFVFPFFECRSAIFFVFPPCPSNAGLPSWMQLKRAWMLSFRSRILNHSPHLTGCFERWHTLIVFKIPSNSLRYK